MRMRGTHITECSTHPLHHIRSAPARRPRAHPPHITVAKFHQTEFDRLSPHFGEHTIPHSHTHSLYQQNTKNTFPVNTVTKNYTLCQKHITLKNIFHVETGYTCTGFNVGTTSPQNRSSFKRRLSSLQKRETYNTYMH